MNRYFIYFSYVGSNYHGWQIQPNAHTVQAEIEKAIEVIHQEEIAVVAAGRTDSGVHAEVMVAHFESTIKWDKKSFVHRMNKVLPNDIGILDLRTVKADTHARFDAQKRTYRYLICQPKNPFLYRRAYQFNHSLDVAAMNAAAKWLLGEKDFSCFSKSKTQTFTNNCNIYFAEWAWEKEVLVFTITANRFLRNMVRAIVGTLIEVGEGKREVDSIPALIAAKKRSNSGKSVSADGLYLSDIEYPKSCFINDN